MEAFTYLSFIFSIVATTTATGLSRKVRKLERIIKSLNLKNIETINLKNLLCKNVGKRVELKIQEDFMDIDILGNYCLIKDVDSKWVHVEICTPKGKFKGEKLLQVDGIQSVELLQ